jgi:hypothetical protein
LQYINEGIIWRGAIEEEEYDEVFTPSENLGKSLSSNYNANTVLDLREHSTSNFNLWSLNENKIRKKNMGRRNQN